MNNYKQYKIDMKSLERKINSSFKDIDEILNHISIDDFEYALLFSEVTFLLLHEIYNNATKRDGIIEARELLGILRSKLDSSFKLLLDPYD